MKNARLTKLLKQYPAIFLYKKDATDISNDDEAEDIIKASITDYMKKNNQTGMSKKTNTTRNVIHLATIIDDEKFPKHETAARWLKAKSPKILVDITYKGKWKTEYDDMFEVFSAFIIRMLRDGGISELHFNDDITAEECSTLPLNESIRDSVAKLKEWICYDSNHISANFRKWFLRTDDFQLFKLDDKGKPTFKGWEFRFVDGKKENAEEKFSTDELSDLYHQKIAHKILSEAKKYMLYGYLSNKEIGPKKRTSEFLQKNCVITIEDKTDYDEGADAHGRHDKYKINVTLREPVMSAIQGLEELLKELSRNKSYTYPDFLFLLGTIARRATKTHTAILCSDFYSYIEKKLELKHSDVNRMLRALSISKEESNDTKSVLRTLDSGTPKIVEFLYKDHRLICEGALYAFVCNTGHVKTNDIVNTIINNGDFQGDTSVGEQNHLILSYNRFLVCNTAVLYYLDSSKRELVLDKLIEIAGDFSAQNRTRHVKAIYLLSYFLIDGVQISSKLRKKMFLATFGTSMYSFQFHECMRLFHADSDAAAEESYFKKFVRETFERACVIADDGYAVSDPYFFFWLEFAENSRSSVAEVKRFFTSAKLQKKIFIEVSNIHNDTFFRNRATEVIGQIREIYSDLRKHQRSPNQNVLYLVYALNILFYALADLANMAHKRKIILDQIMEEKAADELISSCILCDFLTRKFSRNYNQGEFERMYLLCGAFRLVCAYEIPSKNVYQLSDDIKSYYLRWFSKERNIRYKALLYRLLSYTDFPLSELRKSFVIKEDENYQVHFLQYDNLLFDKDFLDNPRSLFLS